MHSDDTPRRVGSLRRLSVDELAAFALQEQLVDAVETFDDRVVITQGDHRFVLPHRQASTFLIGMLRGRSWFVEEGPADRRPLSPPATPSLSVAPELPERGEAPPLDTTLHSLLVFTRELGIINGYNRDAETRNVRIDIPACSTNLTYAEAVDYLFDCLQYEMRSVKERKSPGSGPSPRTNRR